LRQAPLGQRGDGRCDGPVCLGTGSASWLGRGRFVVVGDAAGFQRGRVRGERSDLERCGQAGDDVVVLHVPVQQQNLDQSAGGGGVAVGVAGGCPPGFVDRGELARGPGLFEDRGAGQRARFAQQRFEIELEP
jgi:hypothetical protein